jgi:hypothetical protein
MVINYDEVKKLKSFYGVQLRGNESFTELINIEKEYRERKKREQANIDRVDSQTKVNRLREKGVI